MTMRRIWLLAMTTALILAIALPVGAAKPTNCEDLPPANPHYCPPPPTPTTTTTTTTTVPTDLQPCPTDDWEFSANGTYECDWRPDDTGADEGTVNVTTLTGEVTDLAIFVRDSSPGDICTLDSWTRTGASNFTSTFDLAYGDLPDDEIWDPDGIYPDYAPYENQTYWALGGEHWCYPQDGVTGMRDDLNGDSLHLFVRLKGKRGTTVAVSLNPPHVNQ